MRSQFSEVDAQHLVAPFTWFSVAPILSAMLLIIVCLLSLRIFEYVSIERQVRKTWLDIFLPAKLIELNNFINQLLLSAAMLETERHEVSNWLWRNTYDPILEHQMLISFHSNNLIDEALRWQKYAKIFVGSVVIFFVVVVYLNCYLSIFSAVAK